MLDRFVDLESLYRYLDLESFVIISLLTFASWFIHKGFLQNVSEDRHKNIHQHFLRLLKYYGALTVLFGIYILVKRAESEFLEAHRILPYLAVLCFSIGLIVIVKSTRLLVLEYLFMGSMRSGVPLLVVNIYSLVLSVVLVFWSVSKFFGVQLAPLLATSAAFSIILGLAMQDTLGNLFAGISLQIDKNFEIDDWLEIYNGGTKTVGQVKEISWRSTLLGGFSDELITIPNRVMAQAQISNFSPPDQPILRSQIFRISHNSPIEKCKEWLEQSITPINEVRGLPAPLCYVSDITESWVSLKLAYFIDSYGSQHNIGDKVQRAGLEALKKHGIKLAHQQLQILNDSHAKPTEATRS